MGSLTRKIRKAKDPFFKTRQQYANKGPAHAYSQELHGKKVRRERRRKMAKSQRKLLHNHR